MALGKSSQKKTQAASYVHACKKDGRRGVDLPQRCVTSTIIYSFGLAPVKTEPEKRQSCMVHCAVFTTEVGCGTVRCLWIFYFVFRPLALVCSKILDEKRSKVHRYKSIRVPYNNHCIRTAGSLDNVRVVSVFCFAVH